VSTPQYDSDRADPSRRPLNPYRVNADNRCTAMTKYLKLVAAVSVLAQASAVAAVFWPSR
jgi:hypothetical protein